MKKSQNTTKIIFTILTIILVLSFLTACSKKAEQAEPDSEAAIQTEDQTETAEPTETQNADQVTVTEQTTATEQPTQDEQIIAEADAQTALINETNQDQNESASNESAQAAETITAGTGSLSLQENLERCGHLNQIFECDHYDLQDCSYQTILGQNQFYPTQIKCRYGKEPGETPTRKYCYSLECKRNTDEGNIVISYGGVIAFGEYRYSARNENAGVITHYELSRCGETTKTFSTMDECKRYINTLP
jgi:predicted small lipoprotein YifL